MTAEDYAPILVVIVSGFLQQWLGPKLMLQLTAIPYIASFVMVSISPDNWGLVIASRFIAGLAQGLLSSNVYLADMSHKDHRQTLKMIEVRRAFFLFTTIET